jgi:hypothetical protein
MNLDEKKAIRFKFLYYCYNLTSGNENIILKKYDVGESLSLDMATTSNVFRYLSGEGLLKQRTLDGGFSITHFGIKEVERVLSDPQKPTTYFPAVNIISIDKMINSSIQQSSTNSRQILKINNQNRKNAIEILKKLEEILDELSLKKTQLQEIKSDINTCIK